jgi:hypothetical protein
VQYADVDEDSRNHRISKTPNWQTLVASVGERYREEIGKSRRLLLQRLGKWEGLRAFGPAGVAISASWASPIREGGVIAGWFASLGSNVYNLAYS